MVCQPDGDQQGRARQPRLGSLVGSAPRTEADDNVVSRVGIACQVRQCPRVGCWRAPGAGSKASAHSSLVGWMGSGFADGELQVGVCLLQQLLADGDLGAWARLDDILRV